MKSFSSLVAIFALAGLSAAAPTTTTPAVDPVYSNTVLRHHNVHRSNHSASNIEWGWHMHDWAYQLASQCNFYHNTWVFIYSSGISHGDAALTFTQQFYRHQSVRSKYRGRHIALRYSSRHYRWVLQWRGKLVQWTVWQNQPRLYKFWALGPLQPGCLERD